MIKAIILFQFHKWILRLALGRFGIGMASPSNSGADEIDTVTEDTTRNDASGSYESTIGEVPVAFDSCEPTLETTRRTQSSFSGG